MRSVPDRSGLSLSLIFCPRRAGLCRGARPAFLRSSRAGMLLCLAKVTKALRLAAPSPSVAASPGASRRRPPGTGPALRFVGLLKHVRFADYSRKGMLRCRWLPARPKPVPAPTAIPYGFAPTYGRQASRNPPYTFQSRMGYPAVCTLRHYRP